MKLLRNWGIHFLTAWLLIILFTVVPYAYKTLTTGPYIFKPDGSSVSILEYSKFHLRDLYIIGLFLFLTEITYKFVYSRVSLIYYFLICLLPSLAAALFSIILFPRKYDSFSYLVLMQPVLLGGAYVFAFSLIRDYFRQKKLQAIIQKQQFQNEIDALQAQINPHFLFNSLNYLFSSALLEKAELTAEGISTLSEMMRHTVQEARETFVNLDSEIRFIKNYLKLFLDRMPKSVQDKIIISINISPNQLRIPPLLIIPFIENAFKYGISIEKPMPLEITIDLEENNLQMQVSNYIVNATSTVEGTKTGSWNSQQRLKLLYPNTHRLHQTTSDQRFEVELDMILN